MTTKLNPVFARGALRALGWRLEGSAPSVPKCVMIAAPHTSNWDFPFTLAATSALGVEISWMGKHTLFRGGRGPVLRWLGGIPIDRSARNDVVQGMIDKMNAYEALTLLVPAEGTRSSGEYWKSGFYHIARGAGVPIVPGYLDFGQKRVGVGSPITPTTDVGADMDKLRAFYAGMTGKYPQQFTKPRLREE